MTGINRSSGPLLLSADGNYIISGATGKTFFQRFGGQIAVACPKAGVMGGVSGVGGANAGISDGVGTAATSYITYRSPVDSAISDIQIEFWNGHLTSTGQAAGLNALTAITASLQYNGVVYPLSVAGAAIGALAANAKVLCDAVPIVIPKNTAFAIKIFVSVALATQTWPVGRKPVTGEGANGGYSGLTGADTSQVLGTAGISAAPTGIFGPSNIIATFEKNQSVTMLCGDSIFAGTGQTGGDANGLIGYGEKTLGIGRPWFTNTRSGTKLADFNSAHNLRFNPYVRYCSNVWFNLCTNDIWGDGANLAQMQARCVAAWAEASGRGEKVIQSTCGPYTTSTDGWTTLANQTVFDVTKEANRVAFNDWLRSGPAGVDVVLDTATVCESSLNSGKWRVDIVATTDTTGLHPSDAMVNLLVTFCQGRIAVFT